MKGVLAKWLGIVPATSQQQIVINEYSTRETEVLKNKVWYRGDAVEIEQFYKLTSEVGNSTVAQTRFWASTPTNGLIRKFHSGLPRLVVDKLSGIVTEDMLDPTGEQSVLNRWGDIAEDIDFENILRESVKKTLSEGDGAFKISVDTDLSQYPLIEFYAGNDVDFEIKRGKIQEIQFMTDYWEKSKRYKLIEYYGKGYVRYKLFDNNGIEVSLDRLKDTEDLEDVTFEGDFIMGVPLQIYTSAKWQDRGDALYEGKGDIFDALDECVSTWVDSMRAGRVKQYIPETLIPRDPETGMLKKPDVFNSYHILNPDLQEDSKNEVVVKQGEINYEGLLASYITLLDMALQGMISPSTLGIDVKKLDNAESQREKEKTTMYTRDTIIGVLDKVLPRLVDITLKVEDLTNKQTIGDYEVNFEWGQYANPSFEAMVETVGKAKQYGIMSLRKCMDELYGDTMEEKEKLEEIARLESEIVVDEPYLGGGMDELQY